MEILKKNVGIYSSNTYIIAAPSGECIVMDCGGDAETICDMIEKRGWRPIAIFVTHGHFDHILGVGDLRSKLNIPVYGPEEERELMQDPEKNLSSGTWSGPCSLTCDRWVKGGDLLCVGPFSIQVISTPGHTAGSVVYVIEDACFSGDTLFCMSVGRTDLYSGNKKALSESIRTLMSVLDEDVRLFPGHGPESTIRFEKKNNPYVIEALDHSKC